MTRNVEYKDVTAPPAQTVAGYGLGTQWMNNLYQTYGLNKQGWVALWERQGGKCAGCLGKFAHPLERSAEIGLKPYVDHRHLELPKERKLENVRGLLCSSCNVLLGKVKDNMKRLERLAAYLKAHGDYNE